MKTLNVPTTNMTSLKKSPARAFEEAKNKKTGLYVFNRDTPAGVVLSVEDYEQLVNDNQALQDKLYDLEIQKRLTEKNPGLVDEQEVDGDTLDKIDFNENDGWE
ncbi:type II toxin-antitoxin system Phd/YefM family antitoxin [Lentilactobacillus sp. IMAU92037]|uniref:type II toxin-antitoxin system Phd/YefM family antitoxin n=1 Tax=Lentilactobacillus TaxID=2767893 RepID=UPI001C2C0994|nr:MULTISPECIES: type II toxin-antitoxin system Phd/YefM family antitoxin [Lentilactobacillus]MBV0930012.1 type II toxin-antitoxin system Phd/YefM family antitoxin [Lentilactobacillus dabitei]MDM7515366.1 type II toxin-antitoxin system Phd/YefM family antitoxin [Lentilactobacillus sp. TOM.63]